MKAKGTPSYVKNLLVHAIKPVTVTPTPTAAALRITTTPPIDHPPLSANALVSTTVPCLREVTAADGPSPSQGYMENQTPKQAFVRKVGKNTPLQQRFTFYRFLPSSHWFYLFTATHPVPLTFHHLLLLHLQPILS
ncbi:hypothetical protein BHE74_00059151 [Ensete ventricosum]|nr:hypothetical protein BHE74_00059151 [Ensete ventricosum]